MELRKYNPIATTAEKWDWYTEVYAWRIVRGVASPDDKNCPVDPKGQWHNPLLIQAEVSRLRRIIAAERYRHAEAESRDPDVQAQNQRYARAAAWRAGKLDEYDAIHHPERLAERRRTAPKPEAPITASDLGVTASPSDTGGLQHVADALPERAAE